MYEALGPLAGDGDADVAAFRDILATIPVDPAMVYAGARDALETLTAAGHNCAIVTNKPERLATLLLEQLDLGRFFATVVGGDSLAVCKPARPQVTTRNRSPRFLPTPSRATTGNSQSEQ